MQAPKPASAIQAGHYTLTINNLPTAWSLTTRVDSPAEGIWLVHLEMTIDQPQTPERVILSWSIPCTDIQQQWCTSSGASGLPPDWGKQTVQARACQSAPVIGLLSPAGINRLTIAIRDAVHTSQLFCGVREEDGTLSCRATLFLDDQPPATGFRATLRLDHRPIPWDTALQSVATWWEADYPPAQSPEITRLPFYCTWYSLHQQVEAPALLKQATLASALGCKAIIIDDGWQTVNNARGYGFTGDWQPDRLPAFAEVVESLHALDLKVVLWYAVPFVGFHSMVWERFSDKLLLTDQRKQCGLLDPRFPEVRSFLVETFSRAVIEWNIDGLKLDFIDAWQIFGREMAQSRPGMDMGCLDEAVVALLESVRRRLLALRPDLILEFRQSYTGPIMRSVGNIFRSGDCPLDAVRNRVSILNLRLLAGRTTVQADPIMWHPDDSLVNAALQLINPLFAVPQISVRIDALPEAHVQMVRFYLGWWTQHRECLLDGHLRVFGPSANYTHAIALQPDKLIVGLFADVVIGLPEAGVIECWIVNVRPHAGIFLRLEMPWTGRVRIHTIDGIIQCDEPLTLAPGLHSLDVPPAGLVCLHSADKPTH